MAHVHHEDRSSYYMEQLCTIGVCGALGGVAVMMWKQGMLSFILADFFHRPVLAGGIALLVLVLIRAVTLWFSVEEPNHAPNHDHDREHGPHHPHDHGHVHEPHHEHEHALATHSHNHGHEHNWNPWRFAVLLLPIVLYFLNLPNQGFSQDYINRTLKLQQLDDVSVVTIEDKGKINLDFKELDRAAYIKIQRDFYEGKSGKLKGQFMVGPTDRLFGLVRFKMTCCAADAIPLNVMIVSEESVGDIQPLQWVEVEGQIQFRKRRDRDEYLPVLQVHARNQVTLVDPDPRPYLQ